MLNTLPLPPTRTCPLVEATALETCTPDDDENDTGIFLVTEKVLQEHVIEVKAVCDWWAAFKMILINCFADL